MAVFKPINKSDVEVVSTVINKTQNLNTASLGLTIADYRSGSFADDSNYTITSAGDKYHYYNSVYHNFYYNKQYNYNKFIHYIILVI